MIQPISLSELTEQIQEALKINFDKPIWIRAEISEIRENANGHCYLELIEKSSETDYLLAKTKATIWSSTYRMLKPYFENATGQTLQPGLMLLIAVTVDFHGVYGFNLNIKDIDPIFTIGEMAARRLKIIRQLEQDGVADMNKQIKLAQLPQRIAIISSASAAGYGDFTNQLSANKYKFVFYPKLFPAIMQGEQAESSIIKALEKIFDHSDLFDAVVIIRGGGATADLACFDSYELALNCAQFPLPILSGIGHQRDSSIVDMVAHTSLKTPTAAAEFLIERISESETDLNSLWFSIYSISKKRVTDDVQNINTLHWKIRQTLQGKTSKKLVEITKLQGNLKNIVERRIIQEEKRISLLEKGIEAHSPAFLLKHGYTITSINGKRINSKNQVEKGDKIRTFLPDGSFESEVL